MSLEFFIPYIGLAIYILCFIVIVYLIPEEKLMDSISKDEKLKANKESLALESKYVS